MMDEFDRGDALDEGYLIDRAEHEAHAKGNEEEPDWDALDEALSASPGTAVHEAIEAHALCGAERSPVQGFDHLRFSDLLDALIRAAAEPEFDRHSSPAVGEIVRRWDMATNTQITGSLESQPGTALVLDILDGRRS